MPGLTLVSVTFRAEDELQKLQARSVAVHATTPEIREVIVIDNGSPALSSAQISLLTDAYAGLSSRVRVVPAQRFPGLHSTSGWIGQQVQKLAISSEVETEHYVLLDAKNHLIRSVSASDFVAGDGRARAGLHTYVHHPLLPKLRTTLDYLGLKVDPALTPFPRTATPFVMNTEVARAVVRDVGHDSIEGFAREFVEHDLSEFFLYSGWLLRERGWSSYLDPDPIQSPTIWGGGADIAAVRRAIDDARRLDAPSFGVHRRALRRMGRDAKAELAAFWIERGLIPSRREFDRRVRRFWVDWTLSAARTRRLVPRGAS